jgi:hypothetical protein
MMMNFEDIKNSEVVKNWVVLISCLGMMCFIVESLIALNSFNTIVNNLKVGEIKTDLQDQLKVNKADKNEIQNHILAEKENIVKKSKEFDAALDKFNDDYKKSLNEAMLRMKENDKYIDNAPEIHDQLFMKILAEQQKSDEAFEKNFQNVMMHPYDETPNDDKKCMRQSRAVIRCEKLLYGYTTFNAKNPCDYHPFLNGLPKICNEEKKKDL